MTEQRRILVTAALPYATGHIHIGHLVEQIQTDIWVRFHQLMGRECYFICGEDTHGTGTMIEARKRNLTPEQLIADIHRDHLQDLRSFEIQHSHFGSTNSEENRKLCEFFYSQMQAQKHLAKRTIEQLYCEHDQMFLPDRFVKGQCPKCDSPGQYGDSCDVCGSTYSPTDLKNPACSVCGTRPVIRPSEQILFQLEHFREFLTGWLADHTQKEISNKMMEWFKEPLRDWDISRNAPYFGFQIPGHKDKFFYVWVDAPMGYVSGTEIFCREAGVWAALPKSVPPAPPQTPLPHLLPHLLFDDFWRSHRTELYHFIGKDIAYFHTLFWPALLHMAGFRTPTKVFAHGMLTVNGQKMSKSKGTQINARTFAKHLSPTYLRYYYASKLTSGLDDFDLSMDDFIQRVNSDLVGKITNLGSRGAQMLGKKFQGEMIESDREGLELIQRFQKSSQEIAHHYEGRDYSKTIGVVRGLADEANRYFDEKAPWKSADSVQTQRVLSTTLNLFRLLCIYLKPIVPSYVAQVEDLFSTPHPWSWRDVGSILHAGKIKAYKHLIGRIEPAQVEKIMQESLPPSTAAT
ncbi:MAG: methionine--tRNA ligase, partial [Bdellovibrio sp.]